VNTSYTNQSSTIIIIIIIIIIKQTFNTWRSHGTD